MNKVNTLDPEARLILSEALDTTNPAVDAEWLEEAEGRLVAYRSGDIASVDAEQVFDELGLAL